MNCWGLSAILGFNLLLQKLFVLELFLEINIFMNFEDAYSFLDMFLETYLWEQFLPEQFLNILYNSGGI